MTKYWSALACCLVLGLAGAPASAQSGKNKGKTKPSSPLPATSSAVKTLDARVEKLQEGFIRESADLVKQYEETGQYERAKFLCEVLMKLDPKMPGLKERLDKLTELSLESSEVVFELDVSRSWTSAGVVAVKDRLHRIEASGEYKFSISSDATADGLPSADPATDLVPGIPAGALMGVIVTDNKPGKPFAIQQKLDYKPEKGGQLLLKINVPAGHKCSGKLKVTLSGFARG